MAPVFLSLAASLYLIWYLARFVIRGRRSGGSLSIRIVAGLFVIVLVSVVAAFFIAFITVIPLRKSSPDMTPLKLLREEPSSSTSSSVKYHDFPERLVDCLLIAEDPRFFQHRGFDLRNTLYAVRLNRRQGFGTYGGSTITQQLARTLYLLPDKTLTRKIRELFIALAMERLLDKERILELYLNQAEWGKNLWGVPQAAQHYYGKTPGELDDREIAELLALLPAPLRLTPGNFREDPSIYRRYKRLRSWQNLHPQTGQ